MSLPPPPSAAQQAAQQSVSIKELQLAGVSKMLSNPSPSSSAPGGAPSGAPSGAPGGLSWKVLVYDLPGRAIISPLLSVSKLRALGVTLHLLIQTERTPIPSVPATYFCAPTEENVRRIAQDAANGLYGGGLSLNFTSKLPRPLLELLGRLLVEKNAVGAVLSVVDRYHSHPGFGCWLSGVDINTQMSFEALNPRAVALVVDPIQSVKGKVVIDCFRCINPQLMMMGQEPRQTTSNVGHLNRPSIQALIHGLNRHYYSIVIDYRKNELEEQMLSSLNKSKWTSALALDSFESITAENAKTVDQMVKLSKDYNEAVVAEEGKSALDLTVEAAGKLDPKKHLGEKAKDMMEKNILQCLSVMLSTVVF
ncbi:hypothetical protein TeGR_g7509 [Tetraparma gracilis]|uniref:MPN domain-containing protein n=1 Tax=Tetraparma gracilis TaxID=2962635 RepID=A0ABQ6MFN1_9STRA|nr:hypothetical protein TeGR_g7509 [Tetraparma gracilis]